MNQYKVEDETILAIEESVATHVEHIVAERIRQEALRTSGKFKHTCASPEMSDGAVLRVLAEEVDETLDEADNLRRALGKLTRYINDNYANSSSNEVQKIQDDLRTELYQVIAVGFGWLENMDKRGRLQNSNYTNKNASIFTRSGTTINPMRPSIDMIHIEDIAWGLSGEARFNNILNEPYTVAQHSVLAARSVRQEYKDVNNSWSRDLSASCLLHDASEAYLKDIPSPIKRSPQMAFYRMAEARLEKTIREKFNLQEELQPQVMAIDHRMLVTEIRDVIKDHKDLYNITGKPFTFKIDSIWSKEQAYDEFLEEYHMLFEGGVV